MKTLARALALAGASCALIVAALHIQWIEDLAYRLIYDERLERWLG